MIWRYNSAMLTKLAKVDGKTVLLGSNDGCIVSPQRQTLLNNLSKHRKRIPTPAEKRLIWHLNILCRMLDRNLRYRREMPVHFSSTIGRIVDLSVPSHKLIIEVDGSVHDSTEARAMDGWKDTLAAECGWRTLRFPNWVVLEQLNEAMLILVTALLDHPRRLSRENQTELAAIRQQLRDGRSWETMVGEFLDSKRVTISKVTKD